MPQFRTIELADARSRLSSRAPGYGARAPYRAAIANMTDARMIELEPDAGESMRSLKLNVTRAAREVNRSIGHGESETGTLLVWLEAKPRPTRDASGPRPRRERAGGHPRPSARPGTPRVMAVLRSTRRAGRRQRRGGAMESQDVRVLVVDDDPVVRDVVATVLEGDGYRVETAWNGEEALHKADQYEPDAVILDARMPVMDGWEFLARWRARPSGQRAPVLVVSASRESRAALDRGAQAYLSKPFDIETLETTLASVL